MKASSSALEIICELSQEEIETLEDYPISTQLRWYDGINTKEIPFQLERIPLQQEQIEPYSEPEEEYMGNASTITMRINDEFYQRLLKNNTAGNRFYKTGKLELFKKGYNPHEF